LLQHIRPSWLFFVFMVIISLSFGREQIGALVFFLIFFILALAITLNTSLKRARWQITEIEATTTDFLVSAIQRDTVEGYSIPKYAIRTDLRWVPFERRHIIKLTLFDNDTVLFTLFSDTSKQSEYELEDVVFQIKKELKELGVTNEAE